MTQMMRVGPVPNVKASLVDAQDFKDDDYHDDCANDVDDVVHEIVS